MDTISALQLQTLLSSAGGKSVQLLDVREPYEREICSIGGIAIPLGELSLRLDELDKQMHTVVYCRSGGRSARACEQLVAAGFRQVSNLAGGILGWQEAVDTTLARY